MPAHLRALCADMLGRAAAAGRPLDPVPALVMAQRRTQRSYARVTPTTAGTPPSVRLAHSMLDPAAAERSWTVAHELSHHVRHQEGSWAKTSTRYDAANAAVLLTGAASVAGIGWALAVGSVGYASVLAAMGLLTGLLAYALGATPIRREEAATDVTAALLFGEVLSAAGVTQTAAPARLGPVAHCGHPDAPAASRKTASRSGSCPSFVLHSQHRPFAARRDPRGSPGGPAAPVRLS